MPRKSIRPAPRVHEGLEGVIAARTRLSHVDGLGGRLTIAGFALEALAPRATFEEVLFLLWNDHLPSAAELAAFGADLAARRSLPAATEAVLRAAAAAQVAPMDALRMAAATLSLDVPTAATAQDQAATIVARLPTIVATHARLRGGLTPVAPRSELGHAANFLWMLRGVEPHAAEARALETYLNTVSDHGMNASTFTARVIISTQSDIVSAVTGAIGALKGPLHGGAPGPALDMVFAIAGRAASSGRSLAEEAETFVRQVITQGGRIMGFGHRVYKVRDPRADVLGAAANNLFDDAGERQLYEDARSVEAVVLRVLAELKPDRKLDTNVEFYTALLLHGIGLSTDLFSPTFAIGRSAGWTAHILEHLAEGRLIRPECLYTGPYDRTWIDAGDRDVA